MEHFSYANLVFVGARALTNYPQQLNESALTTKIWTGKIMINNVALRRAMERRPAAHCGWIMHIIWEKRENWGNSLDTESYIERNMHTRIGHWDKGSQEHATRIRNGTKFKGGSWEHECVENKGLPSWCVMGDLMLEPLNYTETYVAKATFWMTFWLHVWSPNNVAKAIFWMTFWLHVWNPKKKQKCESMIKKVASLTKIYIASFRVKVI